MGAWELRILFSDFEVDGESYRRVFENAEHPPNMMLVTGMPRDEWERHYFRSVDEIGALEKALARWARE